MKGKGEEKGIEEVREDKGSKGGRKRPWERTEGA
jgi:hypothetical protein